jgi:hypothetical protein
MAVVTTIFAYEAAFGGQTYTVTNKGMHEVDFEYGGQSISDWLSNPLPTFKAVVDREVKVKIRLREVKTLPVIETTGNLVVKISAQGSTNSTVITFVNQMLVGIRGNQGRAGLGFTELSFEHLSTTGTALPIT